MSKHVKGFSSPKQYGAPSSEPWVVGTHPGPHSKETAIPITLVLRDVIGYADNLSEVKRVLHEEKVLVDGRVVRKYDAPVGIMDVVSFPDLEEHYRIVPNKLGKLVAVNIDEEESKLKPMEIMNKTMISGNKLQYNLHDGTNFQVEIEDPMSSEETGYSTRDTLIMRMPEMEINEHLKFKEGALAFITRGNNSGRMGEIKKIKIIKSSDPNLVTIEGENGTFDTLEDYVIVIGEDEPKITVK